jgi:hypothetical protein
MRPRSWLLLLHQIPPKPAYFRAKVLRRLAQVGALPVKNSVYMLPDNEDSVEDLEWICREIQQQGGAAWLFRSQALVGMSADEIEEAFRQLHEPEYESLIQEGRTLLQQAASAQDETVSAHRKLSRRSEELRRLDFFESPRRRELEQLVNEIERQLHAGEGQVVQSELTKSGRIWITRKGVRVDRIASAWLIRRFVDPEAIFRFVDTASYSHQVGEIRFDMFEGEFTHEGDSCTFEVLLSANNLKADKGLAAIAEIIHDIDLKDNRYQRAETAGVSRLIDGLCSQTPLDALRVERGALIFESLYQSFG